VWLPVGGIPLGTVEWQLVHKPAVAVFQVDVPTWAAAVRPLLWHETPAQVSSLPDVGF